jgi:hypothetical protein
MTESVQAGMRREVETETGLIVEPVRLLDAPDSTDVVIRLNDGMQLINEMHFVSAGPTRSRSRPRGHNGCSVVDRLRYLAPHFGLEISGELANSGASSSSSSS